MQGVLRGPWKLPVTSLGPMEVASCQLGAHGSCQLPAWGPWKLPVASLGPMEVPSSQLPETVSFETLTDQLFSKTCHCPGIGKRDSGRWRASNYKARQFYIFPPTRPRSPAGGRKCSAFPSQGRCHEVTDGMIDACSPMYAEKLTHHFTHTSSPLPSASPLSRGDFSFWGPKAADFSRVPLRGKLPRSG